MSDAPKKARAKKAGAKKSKTRKASAKKTVAKKSSARKAVSRKVRDVAPKAYDDVSTPGGLSKEDRIALKALAARSDLKGLRQLSCHLLLILAAGYGAYATWGTVWYGLAALGLGVALIFLFAPLHETIHRTAFKSRWLNDAVGYVAGFVLILPPNYFRAFHLEHHRFTQIEGKDPELDGKRFSSLGGYLKIVTGLPVWWFHIKTLVLHAGGKVDEPYISGRLEVRIRREAAGYLGLYAGLAAASIWFGRVELMTYWLIPVLLGQPFLRLYLMAEHGGCPLVPDMFKNTRTTRSNAFVRFLAWNMPYHVEHHAFMAVPFHRLSEAHDRFKDRIEILSPSYTAFHRETVVGLMKG